MGTQAHSTPPVYPMPQYAAIAAQLPPSTAPRLPKPPYRAPHRAGPSVACSVPSMAQHMSDEGWQLMRGLEAAGYQLAGPRQPIDTVRVYDIIHQHRPTTVVIQDKREWDTSYGRLARATEHYIGVECLADYTDIFKVTVLKDSHQNPKYHSNSAKEIGCHAWIIYYHPTIVSHLSGFVRPEHLVRTYHSVNPAIVPGYNPSRSGCLLSGAMLAGVYPLREAMFAVRHKLPQFHHIGHPGYHNRGSNTPEFLNQLSRYKVAVCTSSVYGYALRKIIEATACGCRVITDLPEEDKLPGIDDNLVRVDFNAQQLLEADGKPLADLLTRLYDTYDPDRQAALAAKAKQRYDYRLIGQYLAGDIEELRQNYDINRPGQAVPKHQQP